jgi:putative endonuclease
MSEGGVRWLFMTGPVCMYYVYSLKCVDGYYVGCTDNFDDRLKRHLHGGVPATADRLPVSLEFYFATEDKYKAFQFEKYLKSGSGRAFLKKHF